MMECPLDTAVSIVIFNLLNLFFQFFYGIRNIYNFHIEMRLFSNSARRLLKSSNFSCMYVRGAFFFALLIAGSSCFCKLLASLPVNKNKRVAIDGVGAFHPGVISGEVSLAISAWRRKKKCNMVRQDKFGWFLSLKIGFYAQNQSPKEIEIQN